MTLPNEQTKIIERDLERLQTRFDRHLEIYAQNGKELAALKQSVDSLSRSLDRAVEADKDGMLAVWAQTKTNTEDISSINVALSKLVAKISLISTVSASVAASGASFVLDFVPL